MYLDFYGFWAPPFDLAPNPQFLFLTPRHREALTTLRHGISTAKGVLVLIGEAGTGKTTLVRAAVEAESSEEVRCLCLNNPTLTRAEFIEFLARGFGLSADAARSKAALLIELEKKLVADRITGVVHALIVDEAQSVPYELLEEIRLLANMETETQKLLPVVLAGQPELAARLNEANLRQLKQRVALRCDLTPLSLQDTAAYIATRIRVAGGESAKVFTRQAVMLIHERSLGIPRTISVLCDNALISGYALDSKPVGRDIVLEVCRDLDLRGSASPAAPPHAEQQSTRVRQDAAHVRQDEPSTTASAEPAPIEAPKRFSLFGVR